MNVLVVDDCMTVQAALGRNLKEWGFNPIQATDGKRALGILAGNEAPRLVITDWMMPGLSGPEMVEQFRKSDPRRQTYIIMLTAKSGRDVLETAFRCGADDYLTKPVVPEELYRRIREGINILERQDAVFNTPLAR